MERLSRSSSPKLATPAQWDDEHVTGGLRVQSAHTPIWQINDRSGVGFNLAPADRVGGGVLDPDLAPNFVAGAAQRYILGARYTPTCSSPAPTSRWVPITATCATQAPVAARD